MPNAHDRQHLVALIEAAQAEAVRAGEGASAVRTSLEQALLAARGLAASGARPDEGLRPDELTTDNDK